MCLLIGYTLSVQFIIYTSMATSFNTIQSILSRANAHSSIKKITTRVTASNTATVERRQGNYLQAALYIGLHPQFIILFPDHIPNTSWLVQVSATSSIILLEISFIILSINQYIISPTYFQEPSSNLASWAQVVCRLLQARAQLDSGPMAAEQGLATPAAALAQRAGHVEVGFRK